MARAVADWADAKSDAPRDLWRLWVARLRPGRTAAYRAFAESVSRPMFTAHAGCEAVHFLTLDDRHEAVLTRWRDADAVVELHLSARYRDTVAALEAHAVLDAASAVSLFPVTGDLFGFCRRVSMWVERVLAQFQVGISEPGIRASATPGSHVDAVRRSRSSTSRAASGRPARSSNAAAAMPPMLAPR